MSNFSRSSKLLRLNFDHNTTSGLYINLWPRLQRYKLYYNSLTGEFLAYSCVGLGLSLIRCENRKHSRIKKSKLSCYWPQKNWYTTTRNSNRSNTISIGNVDIQYIPRDIRIGANGKKVGTATKYRTKVRWITFTFFLYV